MIYPEIRTSSSDIDKPYIINDVKYIYECARVTKQKNVFVSKRDNCLYMTSDTFCGIHVVKLPFLVNSDMIIYMGFFNNSVFEHHENFFIPDKFPLVLIPEYYWEMYKNGDIIQFPIDPSTGTGSIVDKHTLKEIEYIQMTNEYSIYNTSQFLYHLDRYLSSLCSWCNPSSYPNFHTNKDLINGFFDQKTIYGNFLINFYKHDIGRNIPITFFKGMISLNKSDKLDIEIFSNKNRKNIFLLVMHPRKAKNPIKGNKYLEPFYEDVYYAFREL